ncbi:hypothetical protein GCG54_00008479 [Colletotrichum gloeosporioides]|uniref:Uncharacterized protein n=1 Tax=Colletotrichum gloeosporioides TaxID=474922 RepID=A0A8H4FJ47_COLGL|nr:uncharacterized protein GCG54_00008479 [Colletotrichum gloeosporioides]KAF3803975.1 hypothetical protein GCG54_00008479 [Colletotrichum gloeosporioides]
MAEPLSILGGVAASIQLVECAATALLGTIKFIRDLREIPKKTASRVGDVERSSERVNYICRHILSSGSLTADHIGPDAVTRLSSFFETLRIAIDEAEAVLKSLIEASNSDKHTKALRLWSSLVSSTRESSILEKLRIVHQLNSELTIELEIVGLMTTAATRCVNFGLAAMNR